MLILTSWTLITSWTLVSSPLRFLLRVAFILFDPVTAYQFLHMAGNLATNISQILHLTSSNNWQLPLLEWDQFKSSLIIRFF